MLGELLKAACETVAELIQEAVPDTRPGMVAAVHTGASDHRRHPHVHAITSRGGFDHDGAWHPVPYRAEKAAELLFRQKVIRLLHDQSLLSQEKLEILEAWKARHTGFSAHNRVTVSAQDKTDSRDWPATWCALRSLSSDSKSMDRSCAEMSGLGEPGSKGGSNLLRVSYYF